MQQGICGKYTLRFTRVSFEGLCIFRAGREFHIKRIRSVPLKCRKESTFASMYLDQLSEKDEGRGQEKEFTRASVF
jgi:hypothetical protein